MPKRMTTAEFIDKAKTVHGDKYDYSLVEYKKTGTKVTIICPEHGEFHMTPNSHLVGQGCKKCGLRLRSANNTKTTAQFIEEAKAVHGNRYSYERTEYVSALGKVVITCKEHGDFEQRAVSHLRGSGCSICAGVAPLGFTRFTQRASDVHGNRYDYAGTRFSRVSDKIKVNCPTHGLFEVSAHNHLYDGTGCQKCMAAAHRSGIEAELLADFPSAESNNRSVLDGKEIDILIDGRVGIEVNGRYWHTEDKGKHKTYHVDKLELAKEKGVLLLQFNDDEVERKRELVTSMINSKLGKYDRRVYARKCKLVVLTGNETSQFLQDNHLQGDCVSSVKLGLCREDELVAVMTFGKPRFTKQFDWELLRFASKRGVQVVGGAGKLLAEFRRLHSGTIVSYANKRWSDGAMYSALGFTLIKDSEPSYIWFNGDTAFSRYACQKHKLPKLLGDRFDPNLTERENMERAGFSRMWDCGNLIYSL